ncbi:1,4-dihydroxy-2-naphthoate octaprenyltransferase [Blattabacterium cuenoti]|uniref:1,4-dihydroxy-2-naphthoate octaprenyltransferase n=1 Tax=Blattabacterium cuenoti TaxID=1653831 RepID=UPI00163CE4C4|nr:1,4-dihydroxy-2-naphthoate octaprenyltransferase [Blattabacterium cuenoti]
MKLKYWIYAFRIHTLPLALSGITASYLHARFIKTNNNNIITYLLCILTSISLQLLSNIANDYGDYEKGLDHGNNNFQKKMIFNGFLLKKQVKKAIYLLSILSFSLGFLLIYKTVFFFNILFFLIFFIGLILCILASICYSIGPSYGWLVGCGDLSVLIFFGIISVLGSFFLFTFFFPKTIDIVLISLSIGFLNVSVLNINNMRDIENDLASGKRTMATWLGPRYIKIYHLGIILISILLSFVLFLINNKSVYQWFLLSIIYFLLFKHIAKIFVSKEKLYLTKELKKLVLIIFFNGLIIGY